MPPEGYYYPYCCYCRCCCCGCTFAVGVVAVVGCVGGGGGRRVEGMLVVWRESVACVNMVCVCVSEGMSVCDRVGQYMIRCVSG